MIIKKHIYDSHSNFVICKRNIEYMIGYWLLNSGDLTYFDKFYGVNPGMEYNSESLTFFNSHGLQIDFTKRFFPQTWFTFNSNNFIFIQQNDN
jgi:hypothetical protein